MRIAVAILAAGAGSRLGADRAKPLVDVGGRPLVAHAVDAALASGLAPCLVVAGNGASALREWARHSHPSVEVVENPRWQQGIASSMQAALGALRPRPDVGGVVVGLADQPLVGAEAYRRVARAYDGGAHLAVATYGGTRGNPVLIGRELWDEALTLEGDEGARQLMRHHRVVEVPCDGTGDPTDIDTPEELDEIRRRLRG